MARVIKEPLLHFLLIGAALFFLFGWRGNPSPAPGGAAGAPPAEIVITRDAVDQLDGQFARTWQRPPTEAERERLVEDLVRNEVFYREAVAAGLDRDDEVLKRRLRQRLEFIYEDVSSLADPTDADLAAFMQAHREKYLVDPRLAFRQVFVSTDKRGAGAEPDARKVLARLAAGADPGSLGDPTLLEPEVALSPLWEISKQYGDDFGKRLLDVPPGAWVGPVRSTFGLHLVFVRERRQGRLPGLGEVREKVKQDWTAAKQQELKDAAYARLRQRYLVTVEQPTPVAASTTGAAAR
jgi:hypothetical protein